MTASWLDPRDAAQGPLLRAWLALQARLGLDPQEACRRLARDPDPEACVAQGGGRTHAVDLDARLRSLAEHAVLALPLPWPSYPERLRRLVDAAPLLLVRGDPAVLGARAVAIVGPRAPTRYGLETAHRLAHDLARCGVAVVSGLARGVDAAAHEGALDAGGTTIAFQACGPDRVYPPEHRGLAERIAARGAVVTEMTPGTPPLAAYFPLRNRLIASLAEVVVIVEGRPRSGSLVTARLALERGTEVMAVPGPIDSPASRGPNALLADGAAPVLGADSVLEALGCEADARGDEAATPEATGPGGLLAALAAGPLQRDELARRLGLPPQELATALLELELSGAVVVDRDGRLRLRSGRAGR